MLVDRPIDAGALTDAKLPKDAGREAASDAGAPGTCSQRSGWLPISGFEARCPVSVAPSELLAEIAPSMRPCNNGQAKCTELAIEKLPGDGYPTLFAFPVAPAEDAFSLMYFPDSSARECMRTIVIKPAPDGGFSVGGAVERQRAFCADINAGTSRLVLSKNKLTGVPGDPLIGVASWSDGHFDSVPVTSQFPSVLASGANAFAYESAYGTYDIVDLGTKRLVKTTAPPLVINQFLPDLSVAGELWGTAGYGQYGKAETWRLDATGAWSALIQRKGAHIFAPRTDGTTIFWVEGSGNDADFYPQPKLEVWAAPFTTSQATLDATKRKLLDVSGYGYANAAAAHAGYYTVNIGTYDLLVIRADGASQKVHLDGGWAVYLPAYVDATQVWFTHGSEPTASGTSFARIALDPWP